jgi:hypothetical protein
MLGHIVPYVGLHANGWCMQKDSTPDGYLSTVGFVTFHHRPKTITNPLDPEYVILPLNLRPAHHSYARNCSDCIGITFCGRVHTTNLGSSCSK